MGGVCWAVRELDASVPGNGWRTVSMQKKTKRKDLGNPSLPSEGSLLFEGAKKESQKKSRGDSGKETKKKRNGE